MIDYNNLVSIKDKKVVLSYLVTKFNAFYCFRPSEISLNPNIGWKFHVSIAVDDLKRAWNTVLAPLLTGCSVPRFKVVNLDMIFDLHKQCEDFLKKVARFERLFSNTGIYNDITNIDDLKKIFTEFYEMYKSNQEVVAYKKPHDITFDRPVSTKEDQENQRTAILNFLNSFRIEIDSCMQSHKRFMNGMQVTIYVDESKIEFYQSIAKKLEQALYEAGIKPGNIHEKDKPLGVYCSYRHQGLHTYYEALSVINYNPDNVPDPFNAVLTDHQITTRREQLEKPNSNILFKNVFVTLNVPQNLYSLGMLGIGFFTSRKPMPPAESEECSLTSTANGIGFSDLDVD